MPTKKKGSNKTVDTSFFFTKKKNTWHNLFANIVGKRVFRVKPHYKKNTLMISERERPANIEMKRMIVLPWSPVSIKSFGAKSRDKLLISIAAGNYHMIRPTTLQDQHMSRGYLLRLM